MRTQNEPRRIPVGKCPCCKHPIVYSTDPRVKWNFSLVVAPPDFGGKLIMCAKCKQMLAMVEEVRVCRPVPSA